MAQRIKLPFWRRKRPRKRHDIVLLRPSTLPKSKRFETTADAKIERTRSLAVLDSVAGSSVCAEYLHDCGTDGYRCDQPFCPVCARRFRRWLIGELLRLTERKAPMRIFTVLLQAAPSNKIDELDLDRHRASLRKRIQRSGLDDAVVIGGFEVVYKTNLRNWVLHANLLVIGGRKAAWLKFTDRFSDDALDRPVVSSPLLDRPRQLSYLLKFTTYHRPYKRRGLSKGQAIPLNKTEHVALVRLMAGREFQDFLFFFNARRRGSAIHVCAPKHVQAAWCQNSASNQTRRMSGSGIWR